MRLTFIIREKEILDADQKTKSTLFILKNLSSKTVPPTLLNLILLF
jgi:hypothetical protein